MADLHVAGWSIAGKHFFEANEAGHTISGDVTFAEQQDTISGKWETATADARTGIGFARPGRLAFGRGPVGMESKPGLVEYRWENDALLARWTLESLIPGTIGRGRGTLLEGDGPRLSGRFKIQYQDAAGANLGPPYELTIGGNGLVRTLDWHSDVAPSLVGVGLEMEGGLVAAWGPDGHGLELVDYALPLPEGPPVMAGRAVGLGMTSPFAEQVRLAEQ
jgi:hypothetical protein